MGDSGGPLVYGGVLEGVVSYGACTQEGVCCAVGYPDVFSSVSYYRGWIRQITGL